MPPRRAASSLSLSGLLLLPSFFLSACGHPASRAECEELVGKVAELELVEQGEKDPAKLEEKKKQAVAARGDELVQKCVGRRVTDAAMACVRAAKTQDDIDNRCLR
jgi:hypothetical protein